MTIVGVGSLVGHWEGKTLGGSQNVVEFYAIV